MLTGYTARPHFLKKVTWLVLKHDDRIRFIERLIACHFGSRYLVEVHIVLPAEMTVRQSHDIGMGLQMKIVRLPEVERAFIHIDYSCDCEWRDRGLLKSTDDDAVAKEPPATVTETSS
jgi:divalent metal cation (Fe/Co/Zn/Cd) transporter